MRRVGLLLICVLTICSVIAQNQNGVVKTRGRMINGKYVPGRGLPGAIVSIKNRNDVGVKNADGSFSFPVNGKPFMVQSVNKVGYALVDADAIPKTYTYSPNPIYLVMETPEQITQDKLDSERKIRRTLQRQLQEREDEIEALKAENKISQQKYQEELQKLYADQENNEKLISEMAKRYSELDYDQIDEFYRQVSNYIEQGELTKADSLLRSRGDLKSQIEKHIKDGEIIQQEKEKVQRAESAHNYDKEEFAHRSYGYYESFKMQHQNDSAAYYIELRAKLDTTNVKWLDDAAQFISEYQARYKDALEYNDIGLRQSIIQYGEESEWTTIFYNNIGNVYHNLGDYSKALEYHQKSLEIREKALGLEHPDVATIYNNIGGVYDKQGDYSKALDYHQKSLDILEKVLGLEHPAVAASYNNIGNVYYKQGDYTKSLEYHQKSLRIREKVLGLEHPDVAISYNNIGLVYDKQGDYSKALEYHQKSLEIREKALGLEHPDVAVSYNNIGNVYYKQGDYSKALEYYQRSLEIGEKVLGLEHPDVALSYDNIGLVYNNLGDYTKSLEYYQKSLEILEKALGLEHPYVSVSYNRIGNVYDKQGDYSKSLEYYQRSLEIREKVLGLEHLDVALSYYNIGNVYDKLGDYSKALEYYQKSLEILEKALGLEHPDVAILYGNIGFEYEELGDYSKALEYFQRALKIREKVFGSEHENTLNVKNIIAYVNEIILVKDQNKMKEYVFVAQTMPGDTPAKQKGMEGEYIMLEFADWNIKEESSLYDKNEEMQGLQKSIVVMKGNDIFKLHFENAIGIQLGLKYVGVEEKNRIINTYEKWSEDN